MLAQRSMQVRLVGEPANSLHRGVSLLWQLLGSFYSNPVGRCPLGQLPGVAWPRWAHRNRSLSPLWLDSHICSVPREMGHISEE